MRDSFLRLLREKLLDRPVWTADLSYWMAGQAAAGQADPRWAEEEGYLAFHRSLGVMPYYYYPKLWAAAPVETAAVTWRVTQDGRTTRRQLVTPLGELTEVSVYLPESTSSGILKHFVETRQDLDVLRYVLEQRRQIPANLEDYAARMALWAQYDGLPCLGLPRSPLAAFLVEWAGNEHGVYLLMDEADLLSELFAEMEAQEAPVLDALCALRPPLVHFPDNLSSENLTSLYDAWMGPVHQRRLARLHEAGIAAAVHLDGTVRGLLPKLAAVGFDAIEALTPHPVGDVTLEEMRAVAGNDQVILWGGLPGAMFAPPFTWADVEAHLHHLLQAWAGTPNIIGVADQVPPDGDITFCRRIADALTVATVP